MQWPSRGRGCLPRGDVCLGGVCLGGVSLPRGGVCQVGYLPSWGCIPACIGADPHLWTEFLTRACENITFPQLLLRTVKIVNVNTHSDNKMDFSMTTDNTVVNLSQIVITGMNSDNILLLMSQTMLFVIIFPDTSKL